MERLSNWDKRLTAIHRWRRPSALMGRALTDAIVGEAKVESGMRVLDVASGTGEPAISIATQLQGTGRVVASDISAESLKVGEERARERGLTNIEFRTADVHELPFSDGTFDRVTSRLGVMFFKNPPRAIAEMHRVLCPEGRVSLVAWGAREQPYFDTTLGTIRRVIPELDLPAFGLRMFMFATPGTLHASLNKVGFSQIEERIEHVAWDWHGTPEDLWEYFQQATVPFKPLFEAIPPQHRQEVDAAVLAALHARYDGGQVRFEATVVVASGVR